jgi:SanA protein
MVDMMQVLFESKILRVGLACVFLGLLLMGVSVLIMHLSVRGRVYADIAKIPENHVGLVLGCSRKLANGRDNLFFRYRIQAAAELFNQKKVRYLIVSGDNSRKDYDEPSEMKKALIERGVPASRIFCDYAGFRTLDSVVRAKRIFGCTKLTIVSQAFHNKRAVFVAGHYGLHAIGFNARDVGTRHSFRTHMRELLAKTFTMLDVFVLHRQPKFGGPKIEIPVVDAVHDTEVGALGTKQHES